MNRQNRRRLALNYFVIIMTMSLFFSGVIYFIVSAQLNRPLPPPGSNQFSTQTGYIDDRFAERSAEAQTSVLVSLVIINVIVASSGAWFSYYLSRQTLLPIEQAMESQARFVSDASHELRTPLTALQTVNEVALRKSHIDDKKARQVISQTITETEKLQELANGLLSLATAERTAKQAEFIDIAPFLDEIVASVTPLADKKHIALRANTQLTNVRFQPAIVRQILVIFIDNAIKYSPHRSEVSITAESGSRGILIFVKDNGIGISKSDQKRIFDRFYRADSARTRTEYSGHGLGLAIAKQLALAGGYAVACRSVPGSGSTFELHI